MNNLQTLNNLLIETGNEFNKLINDPIVHPITKITTMQRKLEQLLAKTNVSESPDPVTLKSVPSLNNLDVFTLQINNTVYSAKVDKSAKLTSLVINWATPFTSGKIIWLPEHMIYGNHRLITINFKPSIHQPLHGIDYDAINQFINKYIMQLFDIPEGYLVSKIFRSPGSLDSVCISLPNVKDENIINKYKYGLRNYIPLHHPPTF